MVVPPFLLIRIEAGHDIILPLPKGTQHRLQVVTIMVEPRLQQDREAVGYTIWEVDAGQVWISVINVKYELDLRPREWPADVFVTQEIQLNRGLQWLVEAADVWSGALTLSKVRKKAEPLEGRLLLEEVCLKGTQTTEE